MSNGEGLIFLISQPRAGSTLLQRILGTHSAIATSSEPWLMLHPLSAWRKGALAADYDAELWRMGVSSFFESVGLEHHDFIEAVRRMCAPLYERARKASGAQFFLDKTPRYYLITRQLKEVFPKARFVVLLLL